MKSAMLLQSLAIRSATLLLTFAFVVGASGCAWFQGSAGSMRAVSLGDNPVVLAGKFQHVFYSYDVNSGASFMLSDVPVSDLLSGDVRSGQILHVQLLWVPLAGSTPMDASATNASIRYVVIADGEVGIYSGAGFAMPHDDLPSNRFELSLRDASLQLQEATDGFNDLLSPAQLSGSFTATRDEQRTRKMNREASQLITNALGKTTFVDSRITSEQLPNVATQ